MRIDLWDGEEPPLIICESRATMGVLRDLAYEYLVPITATNGQSGGFIVTGRPAQSMSRVMGAIPVLLAALLLPE